jgi:hypothetical protein
MRWRTIILILAASVCCAEPRCPDPTLRQVTIGGDTINGSVVLHKKPLKLAKVRLYFSSGKLAWIGATDRNGGFVTNKMPPGEYRLEVNGWGSTAVQLTPDIDKGLRQVPTWNLVLFENACVSRTEIHN